MAHGYLGDGYGTHGEIDPDSASEHQRDRNHDRDRHDREWRDTRARADDWRSRDHSRDRDIFFGDRERLRDEGDDHRWRGSGERWPEDRWPEQRGRADSYNRQAEDWSGQHRHYSSNPDDHYLSWRDRHMSDLDRDYREYCREQEHQFHRDFDQWRQNRGSRSQQENSELQINEARKAEQNQLGAPGGMDAATIGDVNAANEEKGRGGGRAKS